MKIRTLKPEWVDDERLCVCSSDARVLSVALLSLSDDMGRGRAGVVAAARVFPLEPARFEPAFAELEPWYVTRYTVRGQTYFAIANWSKHQRIDKSKSLQVLTPEPEEADPDPGTPRGPHGEPTGNPRRQRAVPDLDLDLDLDLEQLSPSETRVAARPPSPSGDSSKDGTHASDPVLPVFEHWRDKLHPRAKLTADRRRKIKARLSEGYTVEQLKRAVDGCAASTWHKERGYTSIGLIFRNAEKTDAFIQAEHKPVGRDTPQSELEIQAQLRAARKRLYEGSNE